MRRGQECEVALAAFLFVLFVFFVGLLIVPPGGVKLVFPLLIGLVLWWQNKKDRL